MPEVIEAPVKDDLDEPKEFGTSLEDIFAKVLPTDDEIEAEKPLTEKKESEKAAVPPKVEPEKKVEAKKESSSRLPESIFDTEAKPAAKIEAKTDVEPVKAEIPPELKGKARENFQKLSDKQFETEKLLVTERKARAQAEAKAAQGDPDAKAVIDKLQEQVKQMSGIVERTSLENHPDFQARFVIPRQQLLETAKTAFADAGGDPEQIESALALTGKVRIERLEELLGGVTSKLLLSKIERAAENIERIDSEKSSAVKNQSDYVQQLQKKDAEARHEAFSQYEKTTKQNLARATDILRDEHKFEVFKTVADPKYQWWNDQFKKMQDSAETIMLKTSDPTELAVAAQLAVSAPVYRAMFHEERTARIKAEERLAQYEQSEPGVGGGDKKSQSQSDADEDEDMPLAQAILKSVKSAGRRNT